LIVHNALHIVTDKPTAPAARGHRARIGIRKRDLLALGLHHLGIQCVQAPYLSAQRRNFFVELRDLGLRHRFPPAIGTIKLREVAGDALVNLLQPPLHLGLREVPVPCVDRFELAAIERNARLTNSSRRKNAARTLAYALDARNRHGELGRLRAKAEIR
jgi:hypothetical protein